MKAGPKEEETGRWVEQQAPGQVLSRGQPEVPRVPASQAQLDVRLSFWLKSRSEEPSRGITAGTFGAQGCPGEVPSSGDRSTGGSLGDRKAQPGEGVGYLKYF